MAPALQSIFAKTWHMLPSAGILTGKHILLNT